MVRPTSGARGHCEGHEDISIPAQGRDASVGTRRNGADQRPRGHLAERTVRTDGITGDAAAAAAAAIAEPATAATIESKLGQHSKSTSSSNALEQPVAVVTEPAKLTARNKEISFADKDEVFEIPTRAEEKKSTLAVAAPAVRRTWWQKGYDDLDEHGIVKEYDFETETASMLRKVSNRKEAGTLLYRYMQRDLGRGIGIAKDYPARYAATLEHMGSARALISKCAEERLQWMEALDTEHPDLGRVLRRCIGASNTGRSNRAKDMLVHYVLTQNPNPCTKKEMRDEINRMAPEKVSTKSH